eukprot:TRINITY_DN1788_c1_g2_i4.p1 TRINITY_DN1788_c1_g2~~TRINITY_DN1788_c1_g2_i4.p1  ORF type:complete len:621 (+),score=98.08 TRINITY_DN1788_c1_g2_i4:66-1928(+)
MCIRDRYMGMLLNGDPISAVASEYESYFEGCSGISTEDFTIRGSVATADIGQILDENDKLDQRVNELMVEQYEMDSSKKEDLEGLKEELHDKMKKERINLEKLVDRLSRQVERLEKQKAEDLTAKITEIVRNQTNLQTSKIVTEFGNKTYQIFKKQSDQESQLTKMEKETTLVKQKVDEIGQRTTEVTCKVAEAAKKQSEQTAEILNEFKSSQTGKKQTDHNDQLTIMERETTLVKQKVNEIGQRTADIAGQLTEILKQSNVQTATILNEFSNKTSQIRNKQSDHDAQLTKIDKESTFVRQKLDEMSRSTAAVTEKIAEVVKSQLNTQTSQILTEFGNKTTQIARKQSDQDGQLNRIDSVMKQKFDDVIKRTTDLNQITEIVIAQTNKILTEFGNNTLQIITKQTTQDDQLIKIGKETTGVNERMKELSDMASDINSQMSEMLSNMSSMLVGELFDQISSKTSQIFKKQSDQGDQLTKIDRETNVMKQKLDEVIKRTTDMSQNTKIIKKQADTQTNKISKEFENIILEEITLRNTFEDQLNRICREITELKQKIQDKSQAILDNIGKLPKNPPRNIVQPLQQVFGNPDIGLGLPQSTPFATQTLIGPSNFCQNYPYNRNL